MKNYYSKLFFFALLIWGGIGCKKIMESPSPGGQTGTPVSMPNGTANRMVMANGNLITGFNVKWNQMPVLSTAFSDSIKRLEPGMLRYPGGTVANYWDWVNGIPTDGISYTNPHTVEDAAQVAFETGSETIFVLDVLHNTTSANIQAQIDRLDLYNTKMRDLKNDNNPNSNYVKYIELGNEIYLSKYQTYAGFQTGADYAKALIPWVNKIRQKFGTSCKIGVVLSAGPQIDPGVLGQDLSNNKNVRKDTWNNGVPSDITSFKLYDKQSNNTCTPTIVDLDITVDRDDENENFAGVLPYINSHVNILKNKIDAYIYHIYIPKGGCGATTTAEARMTAFNLVRSNDFEGTSGKEIWITEYGNLNDSGDPEELKELDKLANQIHSDPDIKIALNQVLVSSITGPTPDLADPALQLTGKLLSNGAFTTGGKHFYKRANPVVINEIYNSQGANGAGDAVELLVVQNGLDIRNLILKKFGGNGTTDNGVAYKFTSHSLWANLKSGTLIVIRNETFDINEEPDHNIESYIIDVSVNDDRIFTKGSENPSSKFNVSNTADMWMIKNPNFDGSGNISGTTDGISNAIHTFASGTATFYLYDDITGSKLYSSSATSSSNKSVYCLNSHSNIFDYKKMDGTEATSGSTSTLGYLNVPSNGDFINQLRAAGW